VAIERQEQPRTKQSMGRITKGLVSSSVIGARSAFDLESISQVVGAVLLGLFLITFMLAFLPWLLAGAMTAAVENVMRQVGFSKFTIDGVGDWIIVFVVGLLAVAFFVIVVTAIAGIANFLSARVTFRRFRNAAVRANSELGFDNREPTAHIDASARSSRSYEERPVSELQLEARRRRIPGRSQMNKAQLVDALRQGRH